MYFFPTQPFCTRSIPTDPISPRLLPCISRAKKARGSVVREPLAVRKFTAPFRTLFDAGGVDRITAATLTAVSNDRIREKTTFRLHDGQERKINELNM